MSHMVIFQAPGGNPGYNQFDSLESAVDFVEQLRNDRDVTNVRIFALEEVKFEMRPYFKVELQALNSGAPAPSASPSASAPAAPGPAESETPAASAAPSPPAPEPAPAPPLSAPPSVPSAPPAPQAAPSAPQEQAQPQEQPGADQGGAGQPPRRGLFGR